MADAVEEKDAGKKEETLEDLIRGDARNYSIEKLPNGAKVIEGKNNKRWGSLLNPFTLPSKLLLGSTKISTYPDKENMEYFNSVLEDEKDLGDVVVRVAHSAAWADAKRAYRNGRKLGHGRLLSGYIAWNTLLEEAFGEIDRSDHYNPFSNTVYLYSNLSSVQLHELGHAKDFAQRKNPWLYAFLRTFPITAIPVMLYQEFKASYYANRKLEPGERSETGKYLFPAFGTYIGYSLGIGSLLGALAGHVAGRVYNLFAKIYDKAIGRGQEAYDSYLRKKKEKEEKAKQPGLENRLTPSPAPT